MVSISKPKNGLHMGGGVHRLAVLQATFYSIKYNICSVALFSTSLGHAFICTAVKNISLKILLRLLEKIFCQIW